MSYVHHPSCWRLVSAFVAMAVLGAANGVVPLHERAGQDEPDPPDPFAHFRSLPAEEQSARLTALAEQGGIMVGLDTPEAFVLLASNEALHLYLDYIEEPLSGDWLDAFEELLHRDDFESARFRAAVLLFRYGRVSGRDHLVQILQQEHNLRAGLVFAIAQEPGTEALIVDAVLHAIEQRHSVPTAMAPSLIRWKSPSLDETLLSATTRDRFLARNRSLFYYRLIVGTSVAGDADPQLAMTELRHSFEDESREASWRAFRAADVLRRNQNDAGARAFLLQELDERPNMWVFRAIEETGDATFIDDLMVSIASFMSEPDNETRDQRNARLRNAEHAIEAIVRLGGDVPVAHAIMLHEVNVTQRLELMMLRSGNELLIDRVRERLGDEEVDRILVLQALKPVPDPHPQYVPDSSRGWVWY